MENETSSEHELQSDQDNVGRYGAIVGKLQTLGYGTSARLAKLPQASRSQDLKIAKSLAILLAETVQALDRLLAEIEKDANDALEQLGN